MTLERYDINKWWSDVYDRPYEKLIPWTGIFSREFPYGLDPPLHDQLVFELVQTLPYDGLEPYSLLDTGGMSMMNN